VQKVVPGKRQTFVRATGLKGHQLLSVRPNPAFILQLPYIFLSLILPYLSNSESYAKEIDAILRSEVLVPVTTQIAVS